MKATTEIASRFREVILSGTWIANTNFKNQLENLDWKIAVSPIQDLNTIAALAQHIHYYIKGLNEVFKGGTLDIKDKFSFDFQPIHSQEQWNAFLIQFWNDAEEFASLVEQMPDEKLNEGFVEIKYGTYKRNIEAMIEHSYYHLGQVVLIKKQLTAVI